MCLACEEAEMFYRFQLLRQIADGKMPEGLTEDELRAMDLPLPGEVEVIVEADGRKTLVPKKQADNKNDFTCDSPE
jgi:hypothetical protein